MGMAMIGSSAVTIQGGAIATATPYWTNSMIVLQSLTS